MLVPFFSIVLPTYNRAHSIKRTIESVLNQTFESWELIIIDDGSTDDTKSVVCSYSDRRIEYFWQKNQERSAARNNGVLQAKGDWVCFIDSDDEYSSTHLETLFESITTWPEFQLHRTGLIQYDQNFNEVLRSNQSKLHKYDNFPFQYFSTFAFKRSILLYFTFDQDMSVCEDNHLLLQIGENYDVKVIPNFTYKYYFDNKFKITYDLQKSKFENLRRTRKVVLKRKRVITYQVISTLFSYTFHSIKENKFNLNLLNFHSFEVFNDMEVYFYALGSLIKTRLKKYFI